MSYKYSQDYQNISAKQEAETTLFRNVLQFV